ncbi:unnamed protein product, partial [Discosporangium mesarthrocarpum]
LNSRENGTGRCRGKREGAGRSCLVHWEGAWKVLHGLASTKRGGKRRCSHLPGGSTTVTCHPSRAPPPGGPVVPRVTTLGPQDGLFGDPGPHLCRGFPFVSHRKPNLEKAQEGRSTCYLPPGVGEAGTAVMRRVSAGTHTKVGISKRVGGVGGHQERLG